MGCCDVGMLRADWMCALPARPGEGVVCGVGGRSGAERCRGGLAWLCVEERVRGKRVNVGGVGILWASEQNGGTARTCCAGRSPSTERPLPCRLHMHMHDRTRLHGLVCASEKTSIGFGVFGAECRWQWRRTKQNSPLSALSLSEAARGRSMCGRRNGQETLLASFLPILC